MKVVRGLVLATIAALACAHTACGDGARGPAATAPVARVAPPSGPAAPLVPHVPLPVPSDAPLVAKLLTLPAHLDDALCKRSFVVAARGTLEIDGRTLRQGDVLVVLHAPALDVVGNGVAAFASVDLPAGSCVVRSRPAPQYTLVQATEARELSWGQGTMSAHLDVERERAPEAYLGRLAGTAAVAEHAHAGSWEVLFALEASGIFTLNGVAYRLAPNDVLFVPAGAKHAWTPDPESRLDAIQMYVPPGPEQRFRALAAVDAGL